MLPAPNATFKSFTRACALNKIFCAQNAEFTHIMRGLTCSNHGTRNVSSTKRNFQNYHRGLYIECEFFCTKCGIHSDHARINLQQSRNPTCYQHQAQFPELSPGPVAYIKCIGGQYRGTFLVPVPSVLWKQVSVSQCRYFCFLIFRR